MQDFWYQNSTKIIFGRDKVDEIGGLVKAFADNVLFVFGKESVFKSGLYNRLKNNLAASNIKVFDHGGVKSNPVVSHAREGIEKVRANKIECILAVGGGSVIDEAKVIAFGAFYQEDVWSFFTSGSKPAKALPVITVPTIAAAGSEMNSGAVISDEQAHQKLSIGAPCLSPKISILDPLLTLSVPDKYTFYGLVDAFSHILEPYFNGTDKDTVVQDHLAEGLFLSLIEISKRIMNNMQDYQVRSDLTWATCLSHNGLLGAGRGQIRYENHLISHSLGVLFDVPHGAALSVVIPGWMRYKLAQKLPKFLQFARRVMNVKGANSDQETAIQGINRLKDWFVSLGVPVRLGELGIKRTDIPLIIANILGSPAARSAPVYFDDFGLRQILGLCL